MEIFLFSIASLVAGFVDAVAGGGGVIVFPVLIFSGLPVSEIVGTNKLIGTAGTTIAAYTFFKRGMAQKEVLLSAAPFTAVGAILGAMFILILPNDFLRPCVSVLVILVALYCYFRPALGTEHLFEGFTDRARFLTRVAALGIGFYDGFFGPGTGIFLTFFFIRVLGCDFLRATANTKVLNLLSNVIPLTYFIISGNIRFDIGIPMALANIAGGYLGAHTAINKGSNFIKWIYLIMALVTGFKLIYEFV